MGIFDRFAKRASIVSDGDNANYSTTNLTGVWASKLVGRNRELDAIKPERHEATKVSAVAARAMDLFVEAAASLQLEVVTDTGETVDHALENLFNIAPNNSQSGLLFWTEVWTRMQHHGECFIILDRGKSRVGEPKSAVIHYGDIKVHVSKPSITHPHGEILAYKTTIEKVEYTLAPSEVLWLRYPDPKRAWGSRAPLDAALEAIGVAHAARQWQAGQLANAGNPSGIVYIGNPANDEDYEAAKAEVEAALTGPSAAGRIAVTGGPEKPEFIKTSFNFQEVGFLDTIASSGEDIALALGVPLDLIGGQRTYANVDASWKIFWEGTVIPRLQIVASELTRQLLGDTNYVFKFNTSAVEALQEGKDAVEARISNAVSMDIVTLDEARAVLGFDPMPNGLGNMTITEYKATVAPSVAPAAQPVNAQKSIEATSDFKAFSSETDIITPQSPESASVTPSEVNQGVSEDYVVRGITGQRAKTVLDRLEANTVKIVGRLANAQLKEAKKRLNRNLRSNELPADPNIVFNETAWVERAYDYILPALYAALEEGARAVNDSLKTDINVDNYITKAAQERAWVLSQQVNATTGKVLRDKLAAAAIADKLTVTQFADILDQTFTDLATWRADMIARTEMVGSFNNASRQVAVESDVVSARQWLATNDSRTREEHTQLDGYRTEGMDDPYPNGLMFPGDPAGDPAETVNCRCVEQYVTTYTQGKN